MKFGRDKLYKQDNLRAGCFWPIDSSAADAVIKRDQLAIMSIAHAPAQRGPVNAVS